eukprot:gene5632-30117_t
MFIKDPSPYWDSDGRPAAVLRDVFGTTMTRQHFD